MQLSSDYRWLDFKQRSRAAILWLILGLPATFLIAELCAYFMPLERHYVLFVVAILWGIVLLWLGVRVSNLRCPRCGNPYFADGGGELNVRGSIEKSSVKRIIYASVGRCCKSCVLKLYSQT